MHHPSLGVYVVFVTWYRGSFHAVSRVMSRPLSFPMLFRSSWTWLPYICPSPSSAPSICVLLAPSLRSWHAQFRRLALTVRCANKTVSIRTGASSGSRCANSTCDFHYRVCRLLSHRSSAFDFESQWKYWKFETLPNTRNTITTTANIHHCNQQ